MALRDEASAILHALGHGEPGPEIKAPGEPPPAGSSAESVARYDAAEERFHSYLLTVPAVTLTEEQKAHLWRLSVRALGLTQ